MGLYEQLETMMTDNVTRYNIVYVKSETESSWKIPFHLCRLGDRLCSGQFGDVYEGAWERSHDNLKVAVKTLKEASSENDKGKLLQEAAIMGQFTYHNVVTMYGVVKDGEPVSIGNICIYSY